MIPNVNNYSQTVTLRIFVVSAKNSNGKPRKPMDISPKREQRAPHSVLTAAFRGCPKILCFVDVICALTARNISLNQISQRLTHPIHSHLATLAPLKPSNLTPPLALHPSTPSKTITAPSPSSPSHSSPLLPLLCRPIQKIPPTPSRPVSSTIPPAAYPP